MNPEYPIDTLETRTERLLDLFKSLREKKGVRSPDDLDSDDPEVNDALNQFYDWIKEMDSQSEAANTKHAHHLANFKKTVFYVDAGFDDPDYLDEVAHDFLEQDLHNAESETEEDLSDVISMIKEKQSDIDAKLA